MVNIVGELYDDAQEACDARAASIDALKIHPYNAPLTVAGQATLGVELVDQVPGLDTVLVAVGGGGLAAGLRLALPSSVRVIAVETEACNSFHAASAARVGRRLPAGVGADALGPAVSANSPGRSWPARPNRSSSTMDRSPTPAATCGRSTNWRWNPQRP